MQTRRRLSHDTIERRQRVDQVFRLGGILMFGGAKLCVDEVEQRNQIRRARELLDERLEVLKFFPQVGQIIFRNEQQRLCAEHLQVALEKNIFVEIRFD